MLPYTLKKVIYIKEYTHTQIKVIYMKQYARFSQLFHRNGQQSSVVEKKIKEFV